MTTTDISAGFIVFRHTVPNPIEYLLLQASDGKHHWTPPKAERETKEESGLDLGDLDVLRGFEVKVTYPVRGAPKDVHYFLARLRNFQQEIQLSDEHQNFRWMTLQDALQVIEHEHTRSVLEQGERFINNLTES